MTELSPAFGATLGLPLGGLQSPIMRGALPDSIRPRTVPCKARLLQELVLDVGHSHRDCATNTVVEPLQAALGLRKCCRRKHRT